MDAISRNITDLAADQRSAIEQLLGTPLAEHQRIVVQVVDADEEERPNPPRTAADYAILADLDEAAMKLFDEAIKRSPSRDQPTL